MRHLLTIIIGIAIFIALFMCMEWRNIGISLSMQTYKDETNKEHNAEELSNEYIDSFWVDTVMYAKGHSFGYRGDVTMWDGWYFDTVPVGDDIMLSYDSIGPSKLRLGLVSRELIVDMGDEDAANKIRNFLNPIDGFKRFQKNYEEILDSIIDKEYDFLSCTGYFSFTTDYADSCIKNAVKINRFICDLAGTSSNEKANVPALSAFYASFKRTKYYRPVYTGNENDMKSLSDFLANKTFENWRRGCDTDVISNVAKLEIRLHIANSKFNTFSKYEYDRIGIGHGMYTETFHTLDLASGNKLSNRDIFKSHSLEKIKMQLFDVMANDSRFRERNPYVRSAADIESLIENWQSQNPPLEDTIREGNKKEFKFELPEGALTTSGVLFSFQPYEIDCWAAGVYHFIVPYEKLMPYLTPRGISLIQ